MVRKLDRGHLRQRLRCGPKQNACSDQHEQSASNSNSKNEPEADATAHASGSSRDVIALPRRGDIVKTIKLGVAASAIPLGAGAIAATAAGDFFAAGLQPRAQRIVVAAATCRFSRRSHLAERDGATKDRDRQHSQNRAGEREPQASHGNLLDKAKLTQGFPECAIDHTGGQVQRSDRSKKNRELNPSARPPATAARRDAPADTACPARSARSRPRGSPGAGRQQRFPGACPSRRSW